MQLVSRVFVTILGVILATTFFSAQAAVYTVVNTNDSGAGSLRAAMLSSLTSTPPNEIHFNIPGPSPHVIRITGDRLPAITNASAIRGDSQPGYAGTPLIHIQGPSANLAYDWGLHSQHGGAAIHAVRVSGFRDAGVNLFGVAGAPRLSGSVIDGNGIGVGSASGGIIGGTHVTNRNVIINNHTGVWVYGTATIQGNYIGVDTDGVTPARNLTHGIYIYDSDGSTIEGGPAYPQVISGHTNGAGIMLAPHPGYASFSSAHTIRGNYIGTDAAGMTAIPNKTGIHSLGGSGSIIGGTSTNQRNIIAGNSGVGLLLEGFLLVTPTAFNNLVQGNYFGLAADGMTPLPNNIGVHILNGRSNSIGGTGIGQANRFGESVFYQVYISATHNLLCDNNSVVGNWIGITTGNTVVAGGQTGVYIANSSNNVIGGVTLAARNVIGGAGTGIYISGTNAQYNRVIGNLIGCGPSGEPLPNDDYGINIFNAPRNIIGGTYTNEANTISGNLFYGVFIQGSNSFHNVVSGNRIGTDPTGTFSVSNRYNGVNIVNGAFSNVVGGSDYSFANVIAGNGGGGVRFADPNTRDNQLSYNFIGMNTNFLAITNGSYGVEIFNASSNLIGGANYIGNSRTPAAGIRVSGTNSVGNIIFSNVIGMDNAGNRHPNYGGIDVADARDTIVGFGIFTRNIVSGNFAEGISVRGVASNTQVRFNYVGTDLLGSSSVKNDGNGIRVSAPFNYVGGTNAGNVVSGNGSAGIWIESGGSNTIVQGNYVGVDVSGTYAVTNGGAGIRVDSHGVLIGGGFVGARNIISGNAIEGIAVLSGANQVTIQGNYIGLDVTGNYGISNRQYGIHVNNATNTVIGGSGLARNVIAANRFNGILVAGSSSNTVIAGNYIGLSANGLTDLGNSGPGITVNAGDTVVGLPLAGYANYIAGNTTIGIVVGTGSMTRIQNNFIGLGANGITNIPNIQGISVIGGAKNTVIGGTNSLERNVIARNSGSEIFISGPSGNHTVRGNYVGVQDFGVAFPAVDDGRGIEVINSSSNRIIGNVIGQVAEALYLGGTGTFASVVRGNFIGEYQLEPITNSSWGIIITNAHNNVIGGFAPDERNFITRNNGGILVTGTNAINNEVSLNLIYANSSRLNIDLGPLGFNTNDVLDADTGANRLQNRPTITNGVSLSPTLMVYVQGVLTSAPLSTYAIDIFRSQGTNASAFRFVGRTFTTTDAGGVGAYSAGFPFNFAIGDYLSATATDPDGNTSELAVSPAGATAATMSDSDNDGIPSFWESLYGLNPAVSNAPSADFDIDGFTDWEEYIADTAANDDSQFPEIVQIVNADNRLISFPSSVLRVYNLEYNDEMATGTWVQVGASVTGSYGTTTMIDTNLPDWRNYRMGVRLP